MTELDQQQEGAEMQSNDSTETDISTVEAPAGDGKDALEIETPDVLRWYSGCKKGISRLLPKSAR